MYIQSKVHMHGSVNPKFEKMCRPTSEFNHICGDFQEILTRKHLEYIV